MIRATLIFGAMALWLLAFATAMVTIIPLAGMGFASIFDGSFSAVARLQGLGFAILGLVAIAALFFCLTRISRSFTKARNA